MCNPILKEKIHGRKHSGSCTFAEEVLLNNRKPKIEVQKVQIVHKNPNISHNYRDENHDELKFSDVRIKIQNRFRQYSIRLFWKISHQYPQLYEDSGARGGYLIQGLQYSVDTITYSCLRYFLSHKCPDISLRNLFVYWLNDNFMNTEKVFCSKNILYIKVFHSYGFKNLASHTILTIMLISVAIV